MLRVQFRLGIAVLIIGIAACRTPEDTAAGDLCARAPENVLDCASHCPSASTCFTNLGCGPPVTVDGGHQFSCTRADAGRGDDRCRRLCDDGRCPDGEQCYGVETMNCSDVPTTVEVCCTAGSNCES